MNDVDQQSSWYRMPIVWMLILIPASAVIMGIIMIWLAVNNDDGLVVDDYYKQGKSINKVLKRDIAAAKYNLEADILLDYENNKVMLELKSGEGFSSPEKIVLQFFHATRVGFDKTGVLIKSTNQRYAAPLPELNIGKWYVQIESGDWRLLGTISIPDNNKIHIHPNM